MRSILALCIALLTFSTLKAQDESAEVILWEINRLDTIGGLLVTVLGNPVVIETEIGNAVEFDGIDDALLIESNPMAGATEFSVEVVFKPYPGGHEEQRFIHFEQDNDNRALIELRLTPDDEWFLDTFIKSGSSSTPLFAEDFPHATNEWWHACLVYKDSIMTHYVNGIEELSDKVIFQPVSSGSTSIGVRQNLQYWYKGAIKILKITHKALSPEEFMSIDTLTKPTDPPVLGIMNSDDRKVASSFYPNPLCDIATLTYNVPTESEVIIKVYNFQLNQVAELVRGVKAPGTHSTAFYRNSLPPGLYIYTLQIADLLSVKNFLILDQ